MMRVDTRQRHKALIALLLTVCCLFLTACGGDGAEPFAAYRDFDNRYRVKVVPERKAVQFQVHYTGAESAEILVDAADGYLETDADPQKIAELLYELGAEGATAEAAGSSLQLRLYLNGDPEQIVNLTGFLAAHDVALAMGEAAAAELAAPQLLFFAATPETPGVMQVTKPEIARQIFALAFQEYIADEAGRHIMEISLIQDGCHGCIGSLTPIF